MKYNKQTKALINKYRLGGKLYSTGGFVLDGELDKNEQFANNNSNNNQSANSTFGKGLSAFGPMAGELIQFIPEAERTGINKGTSSAAKSAGKMALQGAAAGAALGPIGAGVGALAGGALGLLSQNKINKEIRGENMAQESDDARSRMNRLDTLSSTTNSDPSMALAMGGSVYQNDIITPAFLMKKRMLKNGGSLLDGKEIVPTVNPLPLTKYKNGNTHENGGVAITPNIEVEKGETRFEDYVFSNELKIPGSKMTFAQKSKQINAKYKKRENDDLALETKRREFADLMAINDLVRYDQTKKQERKQNIENTAFNLGIQNGLNEEQAMQFAKGGSIRQLLNNARKIKTNQFVNRYSGGGPIFPDPTGDPNYTYQYDKEKDDWIGFNKAGKNLGSMKAYTKTINELNTEYPKGRYLDDVVRFKPQDILTEEESQDISSVTNINDKIAGLSQNKEIKSLGAQKETIAKLNDKADSEKYNYIINRKPHWSNYLAQGAGDLYDVGLGLLAKDKVNFDRVKYEDYKPENISYYPAVQAAQKNADLGSAEARRYIAANSSGRGNVLSNFASNVSGLRSAEGSTIGNILMEEATANATARNAALAANASNRLTQSATNAEIQMNESIARQQEKDAKRSAISQGLHGLAEKYGVYNYDNLAYDSEGNIIGMIGTENIEFLPDKNGKKYKMSYKASAKKPYTRTITNPTTKTTVTKTEGK